MLSTRSSDLHHKTLLIKQDDKFFTRLLSRELSMSRNNNNKIGSFRGLPSSVPFIWESQPGTPKHRFHSADEHSTQPLPPLTPPPSFYSTMDKSSKFSKIKRQSSLNALFHKLSIIKKSSSLSCSESTKHPPASPTISSSSSSTCSSSCPGSSSRTRRTRFGSWGGYSSSSSGKHDEEDGNFINESPTSTLCFMIRKKNNKNNDLQKKGLIHSHEIVF